MMMKNVAFKSNLALEKFKFSEFLLDERNLSLFLNYFYFKFQQKLYVVKNSLFLGMQDEYNSKALIHQLKYNPGMKIIQLREY